MDKQQAAREAFESKTGEGSGELVNDIKNWRFRDSECFTKDDAYMDGWVDGNVRGKSALMPALVEARDALDTADGALAAVDAMLPYGGQLLSIAHSSLDKARSAVSEALARLNAIIGEKK